MFSNLVERKANIPTPCIIFYSTLAKTQVKALDHLEVKLAIHLIRLKNIYKKKKNCPVKEHKITFS